jgi:hypothetical protein
MVIVEKEHFWTVVFCWKWWIEMQEMEVEI